MDMGASRSRGVGQVTALREPWGTVPGTDHAFSFDRGKTVSTAKSLSIPCFETEFGRIGSEPRDLEEAR